MSQDTTDQVATPATTKRTRTILLVVFDALIVLGVVLPNVAIVARPPSFRWLPGTAVSFEKVTTSKLPGVDPNTVGFGLFVVFLGLALWILGAMMTVVSSWILLSSDLNAWLWIFLLIGTVLLSAGVPTVGLGKFFLDQANAPTSLGLAWFPTFIGGFCFLLWTLHARKFIERTFYDVKPDLIS